MWERFCRNRGAVAGLLVLALFFSVAMLAPLATTYQPEENHLDQKLLEPTPAHLLGTDHLGRDILARLAYGARFSLLIGFAAVGVGLAIGVPLGAVSGFYGGWLDLIIQRVIDVLLSLPGFLLALSLVAVLGVGIVNVILAVGLGVVPAFVRLVRASTLPIRSREYVEAARAWRRRRTEHHLAPRAPECARAGRRPGHPGTGQHAAHGGRDSASSAWACSSRRPSGARCWARVAATSSPTRTWRHSQASRSF